jgi:hypothetical protein
LVAARATPPRARFPKILKIAKGRFSSGADCNGKAETDKRATAPALTRQGDDIRAAYWRLPYSPRGLSRIRPTGAVGVLTPSRFKESDIHETKY